MHRAIDGNEPRLSPRHSKRLNHDKNWHEAIWGKNTVKLTIISTELFKASPRINIDKNQIIINPQDYTKNIKQLKKSKHNQITIYDHTKTQKLQNNETVNVIDHINRAGHNPLIGHQHLLKENFIDISNIYKSKTGVITNCLGDSFSSKHERFDYPSHYLCYISILCKALGLTNTKSKLINII